jgi:hypothetical protein
LLGRKKHLLIADVQSVVIHRNTKTKPEDFSFKREMISFIDVTTAISVAIYTIS